MRKVNLSAGKATVLLFFCLVAVFHGCKKTDRAVDEKNIVQVETRFFNENISSSPQIQAIANFLQRENRRNPFVEKLVNHTGFPIWNKSMIVANESRQGQSRERPGNTVIFIPFAKDDQRVVSAAIRVTITPQRDTLFKVLLASKYLDTAATGMKPRHLSLLLMKLDNAVFGHNVFQVNDPASFDGFKVIPSYVRISDQPSVNIANKLVLIEYTLTVCYTITYPGFCDGQVHGVGPGENPYCTEYLCESISWTEWEDDGSGGGGGGWPTDGGGGGDGTSNPCRPIPGIGDPCGGGQGSGGWEPVPIDDEILFPPCDATDQSSGASATVQFISLASTAANFTPFDTTISTQPEQYFLVNNNGGAYLPGPIDTLSTTGGSMQGITSATHMVVHTHPYGGYPFPSPADLYGLSVFSPGFMMNFVIGYNGTKYAMVVNSYSQLLHFITNNASSFSTSYGGFVPGSPLAIQSDTMRNRLVRQGYWADEAYERTLAYIMKQAGVTLVKAPVGSNTFKKIGIRQKIENGSPAVVPSGTPIYENADCQ